MNKPDPKAPPAPDPAPPAPPAAPDPGGAVPRFVKQTDRAPAGLRRFKVRAAAQGGGVRYVVARGEADARDLYLSLHPNADLVITELPD